MKNPVSWIAKIIIGWFTSLDKETKEAYIKAAVDGFDWVWRRYYQEWRKRQDKENKEDDRASHESRGKEETSA